jgi:hypothetical protein
VFLSGKTEGLDIQVPVPWASCGAIFAGDHFMTSFLSSAQGGDLDERFLIFGEN